MSQFTQNIGHIYMFDDKQGIEEQHEFRELKKCQCDYIFDWL